MKEELPRIGLLRGWPHIVGDAICAIEARRGDRVSGREQQTWAAAVSTSNRDGAQPKKSADSVPSTKSMRFFMYVAMTFFVRTRPP